MLIRKMKLSFLAITVFALLFTAASANASIWSVGQFGPHAAGDVTIDPFGAPSNAIWSDAITITAAMSGVDLNFTSSFTFTGNWTPNVDSVHFAAVRQVGTDLTTIWQRDIANVSGSQTGLLSSVTFNLGEGVYYMKAWADLSTGGLTWGGDYAVLDYAAPAATPIPAAIWLLGTGLVGIAGLRTRWRRR